MEPNPGRLPPGIGDADFRATLREFAQAVGEEWVFSDAEDVATYRDAYSILWNEPEERFASAAVAPASVEEVQKVVAVANRHRVPLYAISTGKNLAYGGSAPNLSGSVVVDLKRMNRIIEVDDRRNFAIVEPGVSYFDLYRHIQDRGLKVWIDVPGPGWGSPLGNALDRGVGSTYGLHRDHWGSHCGLEAVLPNGEIMRTGMGALPGAKSWAEFKYGFGPTLDGLFSQGNFGIVTKMGFWLYPEPESYLVGTIDLSRYEDLIPLVDVINYLEDGGLVGRPQYAGPAATGRGPHEPGLKALLANGWPSFDAISAYAKSVSRPCWTIRLNFYGPAEANQANWEYAKRRVAAAVPAATFRDGQPLKLPLTAAQKDSVPKGSFGIPSMEIFDLAMRKAEAPDNPPSGHTDFGCVMPRSAEALFQAQKVFWEVYAEHGEESQVTPFTAPLLWHMRCFIVAPVIFAYHDPERNRKSRALFNGLVDAVARNGWAPYRAAPAFQDRIMSKYSFGEQALLRFTETLKDAADPNGIIAPGRAGVWPKAFRDQRPATGNLQASNKE